MVRRGVEQGATALSRTANEQGDQLKKPGNLRRTVPSEGMPSGGRREHRPGRGLHPSGIGLLNEKPLHASLKGWCAQPGDRFEVPIDGYVIDIVRNDLLLEIQTGSVASIKAKLAHLLRSHQIRLVYPIAQEKWIVRLAKNGGRAVGRRRSPKKGRVEDLFWEMVSIPRLLSNRNLSLEVLLIREEEARRYQVGRNWRRKGWAIEERRLLEVVDRRSFDEPADWLALLPEKLARFTARDLAQATGIRLELAQKMAYCLRQAGVVELIGRRGRANLYAAGAQRATAQRV